MPNNRKQIVNYDPKSAILAMLDGEVFKNREGRECFYNDELNYFEQREPFGKKRSWNLAVFEGLYKEEDEYSF